MKHIVFPEISKSKTNWFKGIGILLIVLHNLLHFIKPNTSENEFSFSISNFERLVEYFTFADAYNLFFSYFGHYGVQLFIFISGYGLFKAYSNKKIDYLPFLFSRIRKLYPTFLIAVVCFIILNFYTSGGQLPTPELWKALLLKLLFVANFFQTELFNIVGPWWFYSFIVQIYIVFPLLIFLHKKYQKYAIESLILIVFIVQFLIHNLLTSKGLIMHGLFLGHLPEFLLGMWFAKKKTVNIPYWLVIVVFIVFCLGNINQYFWYFSFISISLLLILLVHLLSNVNFFQRVFGQTIEYYGIISMYLFAINGFLRTPFVAMAESINNPYVTILISIVYLAIVTAMSHALMVLVEIFTSKLEILQTKTHYRDKIYNFFEKPFWNIFIKFFSYILFFLILLQVIRVFEILNFLSLENYSNLVFQNFLKLLVNDIFIVFSFAIILLPLYFALSLFSEKISKIFILFIFSLSSLFYIISILFFKENKILLDEVIYFYSTKDFIANILLLSLKNWLFYIFILLVAVFLYVTTKIVAKIPIIPHSFYYGSILVVLSVFFAQNYKEHLISNSEYENNTEYNVNTNKMFYFVKALIDNSPNKHKIEINQTALIEAVSNLSISQSESYTVRFPLLTEMPNNVTLNTSFVEKNVKPNIVIFVTENLYFTDSIKTYINNTLQNSYLFNNCNSAGGKDAVIASITGSYEVFAGGLTKQKKLPLHFNIYNLLLSNGYSCNFLGNLPTNDGVNSKILLDNNITPINFVSNNFSDFFAQTINNLKNGKTFEIVNVPTELENDSLFEKILSELKSIENEQNIQNTIFVFVSANNNISQFVNHQNFNKLPVLFYSSLIEKNEISETKVSYTDIYLSLCNLLKTNYKLKIPEKLQNFATSNFQNFPHIFFVNDSIYCVENEQQISIHVKESFVKSPKNIPNSFKDFFRLCYFSSKFNSFLPENYYYANIQLINNIEYFNNFENNTDSKLTPFITDKYAISGKNSLFVANETEFIPIYEVKSFNNYYLFDIQFETMFSKSDDLEELPLLVVELKNFAGEQKYWEGFDLKKFMLKKDEWQKINFSINLATSVDIEKDDILSIYFWNRNKNSFFIDDLTISGNCSID